MNKLWISALSLLFLSGFAVHQPLQAEEAPTKEKLTIRLTKLAEVINSGDKVDFSGKGTVSDRAYDKIKIALKDNPQDNAKSLKSILIKRIPEGNVLLVEGKGFLTEESKDNQKWALIELDEATYKVTDQ